MLISFDDFVDGCIDVGPWLRQTNMDIGGGKISISDIDLMKKYPEAEVATISGLDQETFEYFVGTYGRQLKAIRFFKNKRIEDLSPLGTLPELEHVDFFANQRVNSLWDMSSNTSLIGLSIADFSQLHSIENVQTAPNLEDFRIGNAIWCKMTVDSLLPLSGMKLKKLVFTGRAIVDQDLSFLEKLPVLSTFDFPANMLTTEQVAWIVSNFPSLNGFALSATIDYIAYDLERTNLPGKIIVGKRKPGLVIQGNEKRIEKYIANFDSLVEKYRNMAYHEAFPKRRD